MKKFDYIIYVEGGYNKNVNLGAYAVIVINGRTLEIKEERTELIRDTNSARIYLDAIKDVIDKLPFGASVQIRCDAEYAVYVLNGRYRAKKNIDVIGRIWNTTRVMEIEADYLWCSEQHGDIFVSKCWDLSRGALDEGIANLE